MQNDPWNFRKSTKIHSQIHKAVFISIPIRVSPRKRCTHLGFFHPITDCINHIDRTHKLVTLGFDFDFPSILGRDQIGCFGYNPGPGSCAILTKSDAPSVLSIKQIGANILKLDRFIVRNERIYIPKQLDRAVLTIGIESICAFMEVFFELRRIRSEESCSRNRKRISTSNSQKILFVLNDRLNLHTERIVSLRAVYRIASPPLNPRS